MLNLELMLGEFKEYLTKRGLSERTVESYALVIELIRDRGTDAVLERWSTRSSRTVVKAALMAYSRFLSDRGKSSQAARLKALARSIPIPRSDPPGRRPARLTAEMLHRMRSEAVSRAD